MTVRAVLRPEDSDQSDDAGQTSSAARGNNFGLLRLPDAIHFGWGARASLPGLVRSYGARAFVCVDPFLAGTAAFADAKDALERSGVQVTVFTDVVPELPVAKVVAAAAEAAKSDPQVVVGYGGGSAIDMAKLLSLQLAHPGPLAGFYGENAVPGPVLPLVAVPTTAGTGSEVTPVAVVSDPDRELKVGISSPHLIPRAAVVDPELTLEAPRAVTAYAGIDAFVHAVESYTAAVGKPSWSTTLPVFVGRNELSSLLAEKAISVIGGSLTTAVRTGSDRRAREDMAYGSLLAGMAFGTGGTHLSHALQYPVGALTHTPHGLGTGLLLPYVMQACLPATTTELARIADLLKVGSGSTEARADAAVTAVAGLNADIGIPRTLSEIGVAREQLPRIAELAMSVTRLVSNAAVAPSRDLIDRILAAALNGAPVALG